MSGGHYNNLQSNIRYIYEQMESELENMGKVIQPRDTNPFDRIRKIPDESDYIKEIQKEAISLLKKAYIYTQRLDWYYSGDDSEESLKKRLKEELDEISN